MSESIEALTGKSREAILEDLLDSGRSVTPVEYIARTEIIRLTARIAELEKALTWQPIDTAPTDGTRVLIFRKNSVAIGEFDDDKYLKRPVPFWNGTDVATWGKAWGKSNTPTHWMPMPPEPDVTRTTLEASKCGGGE